MKKENTNEDNISNGFKCEENNENLQECESGRNILFIGDSVMLGAGIELQNTIPDCIVEAAESRQVWDATEIVNKLKEEGGLGECVVVGLGSNGSFDERSGQEFIDSIGADRKIYWISVKNIKRGGLCFFLRWRFMEKTGEIRSFSMRNM